jgi:hypothetical protein
LLNLECIEDHAPTEHTGCFLAEAVSDGQPFRLWRF